MLNLSNHGFFTTAIMQRQELLNYLNDTLCADSIHDYCPNGLQIEGTQTVQKITTGVTASQALIDAAIANGSDTIIVHHGYFWKGESPVLTGMKAKRIKALLVNDINLFGYHLPLDVHPELGNNAQLAKLLGITVTHNLAVKPDGVVKAGLVETSTLGAMAQTITQQLQREPLVIGELNKPIETIAWCTGGGQGYIEAAAEAGMDLFISGEVSEQTVHFARENDIAFIAAGHHATERYGVKALGEHLAQQFALDVCFIDIDNPA